MATTDRFALRFLIANLRKRARSRGHNVNARAESSSIQLHSFSLRSRVNLCGISSRVETTISRRARVTQLSTRGSRECHYCSINTERRNSENCWSFCGNPGTSNSANFRTPLINKHLDLFRNGPPLASYGATRPSTYVLVSRNVVKS
jgi:hypothetical protein